MMSRQLKLVELLILAEWTKGTGGPNRTAAHYQVTQNIYSDDDEELKSYVMNDELHAMLKDNKSFFFQAKI